MGSVARSIGISTIGNLAPPIAGFLSAPILAHALGLTGRGEVGAATAPLVLGATVFSLGLPEALTYYTAKYPTRVGRNLLKACAFLIVVGFLATAAFFLLAGTLADHDSDIERLIRLSVALLVPSLMLTAFRGLAAGFNAWGLIAWERTVGSVLRLVLVVYCALTDTLTVTSAVVIISVTTFAGAIVYVRLLNHARRRRTVERAEEMARARLLSFGMRMWLGSLAGILLSRLDQLLITPLSTVEELGIYVVAVAVSEMVLVFNSAVRDVLFAAESEAPDVNRLGLASRLSTLFTLTAAIGVAAISTWGVPLLFGQEFAGAVPVVLLLLVGIVLGNPGSVAGAGLSARGRPGLRSISLVLAVVTNVIAVFILVPQHGAVGAAIATVIGNATAGYANIMWLKVKFGIPVSTFVGFRKNDADALKSVVGGRLSRSRQDT